MLTLFPLKPSMQPGDMVALFTSTTSRADAEHWLTRSAPRRVRDNAPAMTLRTFDAGNGCTSTVVRVGRF